MIETNDCSQLSSSQIHHLGRVAYADGLAMQQAMLAHIKNNDGSNQILVLEHNSVFTIGRNASRKDIHATDDFLNKECIEIHNVDRGGQVTYHGPGQIIIYPICNLKASNITIRKIVYHLEEAMICTAADFNVTATRLEGFPGVWVNTPRGPEKLGALGLHVHQWITTHGIAFNVEPNLTHFQWITPCGITDKGVCSLKSLLDNKAPAINQVIEHIQAHLVRLLGLNPKPIEKITRNFSIFFWQYGETNIEFLMSQELSNVLWSPCITGQLEDGESPLLVAQTYLEKYTNITSDLAPMELAYTSLDKSTTKVQPMQTPTFNEEIYFYAQLPTRTKVTINSGQYLQSRWCGIQEAKKIATENRHKLTMTLLSKKLQQDTNKMDCFQKSTFL